MTEVTVGTCLSDAKQRGLNLIKRAPARISHPRHAKSATHISPKNRDPTPQNSRPNHAKSATPPPAPKAPKAVIDTGPPWGLASRCLPWPQPNSVAQLLSSGPATALTREDIRAVQIHETARPSPMTVSARIHGGQAVGRK